MARQKQEMLRAYALIFMAGLAGVSILLGIFLIFSPNYDLRAQRLADAGAVYLIEASKIERDEALFKLAYEAHLKSVQFAPYKSDLWVRLAYAANAMPHGYERAVQALEIAGTLDPALDIAAYKHQLRLQASGS